MLRLRRGKVVAIAASRPGAIEVQVEVEGRLAPAIDYPDLVGPVAEGDGVLLNTTGLTLGLGTGGFHLVGYWPAAWPPAPAPGARGTLRRHGAEIAELAECRMP